jgi:HPt (histidine-containing phosphotransfer) domain-containing protein
LNNIKDPRVRSQSDNEAQSNGTELPEEGGFVSEELLVLDKPALMTRLGDDRKLLKELQQIFVAECPRYQAKLHGHLHARENLALGDAAHALKGMLATLSALRAEQAAQNLEIAVASKDMIAAAAALDRVDLEVELVLKTLAEMVEA